MRVMRGEISSVKGTAEYNRPGRNCQAGNRGYRTTGKEVALWMARCTGTFAGTRSGKSTTGAAEQSHTRNGERRGRKSAKRRLLISIDDSSASRGRGRRPGYSMLPPVAQDYKAVITAVSSGGANHSNACAAGLNTSRRRSACFPPSPLVGRCAAEIISSPTGENGERDRKPPRVPRWRTQSTGHAARNIGAGLSNSTAPAGLVSCPIWPTGPGGRTLRYFGAESLISSAPDRVTQGAPEDIGQPMLARARGL